MVWEIIKLIFYLLIFAVVIWATYFTCKKLAVRGANFGSSKYMQIVDRMMLGKDIGIAVIKIGDKYLLVSQTSEGVQLMREFTDEEFEDIQSNLPDTTQNQNPLGSVFDSVLSGNLLGIFGKNKSEDGKGFDFSRFLGRKNSEGEILGRYDGDLTDVENIDFDAILKKGMRNSEKRGTKNKSKRTDEKAERNLEDRDAVDEILDSVDRRKKSFDLRKEENNATDEA